MAPIIPALLTSVTSLHLGDGAATKRNALVLSLGARDHSSFSLEWTAYKRGGLQAQNANPIVRACRKGDRVIGNGRACPYSRNSSNCNYVIWRMGEVLASILQFPRVGQACDQRQKTLRQCHEPLVDSYLLAPHSRLRCRCWR